MALTLEGFSRQWSEDVAARYTEYRGRRIPCKSGEMAYHLKPEQAEAHCGPRQWVRAIFSEYASIIHMLPMVGVR